MSPRRARRGAALMIALVTLLVVMLLTAATLRSIVAAHRQQRINCDQLQAEWLAEAGLARAAAQLVLNGDYPGETWRVSTGDAQLAENTGIVKIQIKAVEKSSGQRRIDVVAQYPDHLTRRAMVIREQVIVGKAK